MTRLFVRIEFDGDERLGPGKVRLLELIREQGSISAAARAMPMSYRRAWLLVDALNTTFADKLVATKGGGRGGGAASLTPLGEAVIARYRDIEQRATRAVQRDVAALERTLRRTRRPTRP